MKVDIISREIIKPSSPTPSHLKNFKLSFLDQCFPPYFIPLILYYSYNETSNLTQSDMCYRLKRSLPDALTQFYPLAGRFEGENSVDCNDEGVKYLEARVNCQLSDIIQCPEVEVLDKFIPYNLNGPQMISANEQIAIQVNLFNCGGIVLGICMCHRIADACTSCTFIKTWSAMACGKVNFSSPIFNSANLFPPADSLGFKLDTKNPTKNPQGERLLAKRFDFSASAITALKEKVTGKILQPTRVEVVSAFIWRCYIKKGKKSAAFHMVNFRGRMEPPLPENSFGNIFQMAAAVTDGEVDELGFLVGELRASLEKIDSDFIRKLLGDNGFEFAKNNFRNAGQLLSQKDTRVLRFTSWCRFPVYEPDFGWGRPVWASSASFNSKNVIFLMDSRDGGIEAWANMNEQDMAEFEQGFDLQMYISSSPPGN